MPTLKENVQACLADARKALSAAEKHLKTVEEPTWDEVLGKAITTSLDATALLQEYLVQGLLEPIHDAERTVSHV